MNSFDHDAWRSRIMDRTDLSLSIVHLTRGVDSSKNEVEHLVDSLFQILDSRIIKPSTSEKGFINGNISATCFQESPIIGIGQNIINEQNYRKINDKAKVRYKACGLQFSKLYAFKKGVRPVIYEQTAIAKEFLPPDQYWRIVNFDLSNEKSIIDWTHEREWRCPGGFNFEIEHASVILPNQAAYRLFVKRCLAEKNNYLQMLNGICQMRMTI